MYGKDKPVGETRTTETRHGKVVAESVTPVFEAGPPAFTSTCTFGGAPGEPLFRPTPPEVRVALEVLKVFGSGGPLRTADTTLYDAACETVRGYLAPPGTVAGGDPVPEAEELPHDVKCDEGCCFEPTARVPPGFGPAARAEPPADEFHPNVVRIRRAMELLYDTTLYDAGAAGERGEAIRALDRLLGRHGKPPYSAVLERKG